MRLRMWFEVVEKKYDGDEERFKVESKRSIINACVVNFVEVDPANPDLGWVTDDYYFSDIGFFLKRASASSKALACTHEKEIPLLKRRQ